MGASQDDRILARTAAEDATQVASDDDAGTLEGMGLDPEPSADPFIDASAESVVLAGGTRIESHRFDSTAAGGVPRSRLDRPAAVLSARGRWTRPGT